MKKYVLPIFLFTLTFTNSYSQTLVYHTIQKDGNGKLLPWYNPSPASSYDHDLQLIWNFWKNFPSTNGVKNYMTDHAYCPTQCSNKVGGDQFAMALSSWALYYQYTGDTSIIPDMVYIANTYMAHSLSSSTDVWPNIPYPCNYGNNSSTVYDGDFLLGAGVTQPDKAGSIAAELVTLYKITGDTNYLHYAINIANTLAAKIQPGSSSNSPYPFKVNAQNGSVLLSGSFGYTGNVVPTMQLFQALSVIGAGNTVQYDTAYAVIKRWVKNYPLQSNNWGNFFEDIYFPSNTEINAVTMAYYILQHPDWSSTYVQDARGILNWTLNTLGSHAYDTLGVTAIYEQTVDLKEGGSHTSRFASTELLYALQSGDTSRVDQAIRQLNWATYLCDTSGQCRFSPQEGTVWLTDGYGDYVRHFLRAMASYPAIAPDSANHLLGSSSVITNISYEPEEIRYLTFDDSASEILKLTSKPSQVKAGGVLLNEQGQLNTEGWLWTPANNSVGVLKVRHDHNKNVEILWNSAVIAELTSPEGSIKLFPNPAKSSVKISCSFSIEQPIKIELVDLTGRVEESAQISATTNNAAFELNLSGLQPGSYFVQITNAQRRFVKKLVVVK